MKKKIISSALLLSVLFVSGCTLNGKCNYNVTCKGDALHNHLIYNANSNASNDENFEMSFVIDYNYELLLDNIHVSIGGKENKDCWSFLYQTNVKNVFTIDKSAITGDIEIEAKATYRTSTPSEYGYLFGEDILAICNCRFMDNRQMKFIPTLDQNAYPVMEDDAIEVIISLKENEKYEGNNKVIMDNIWFRTNARYAKIDEDFVKTYSADCRECRVYVPHYVIRDHGSFKVNENLVVEASK